MIERISKLAEQLSVRRDAMLEVEARQYSENYSLAGYVIEFWDRNNPLNVPICEVTNFEFYVRAVYKLSHEQFLELYEETRNITANYEQRLDELWYEGE